MVSGRYQLTSLSGCMSIHSLQNRFRTNLCRRLPSNKFLGDNDGTILAHYSASNQHMKHYKHVAGHECRAAFVKIVTAMVLDDLLA